MACSGCSALHRVNPNFFKKWFEIYNLNWDGRIYFIFFYSMISGNFSINLEIPLKCFFLVTSSSRKGLITSNFRVFFSITLNQSFLLWLATYLKNPHNHPFFYAFISPARNVVHETNQKHTFLAGPNKNSNKVRFFEIFLLIAEKCCLKMWHKNFYWIC